MFASGNLDLVFASEEIPRCSQIAAGVRSPVGDLRSAVQGCSAADNHRADGLILIHPARQRHGGSAIEIKSTARKAKRGAIDHAGGKNMGLTQTDHLFAQENVREADRIGCRRMSVAVIEGINSREGIYIRHILIQTNSAKVFANMLHRVAEGFGDSARGSRR